MTLAIRTTVVPITLLIGTTVVRISGVIRTTGKSIIQMLKNFRSGYIYVDKYYRLASKLTRDITHAGNFHFLINKIVILLKLAYL